MKRFLILAAVALALGGCANGFSLVAGERAQIGSTMSIAPGGIWNRQILGNNEIWTLDGPALQTLRFVAGAAEGEPMMPRPNATFNEPQKDAPKFHDNMTPPEVAELLVATFTQLGANNTETKGLKPAKFGADDGFRFEISYAARSGLECQGFAVGRIKDKKLYMAIYTAPKLFFFERDRGRVEHMIETLRFDT